MYAFLSHDSACEALRALKKPRPSWPPEPRKLPLSGDCISNQRSFRSFVKSVDLAKYGVVTQPVELLVPSQSVRSRGKAAHFHVWSGPIPAGSMIRLTDGLLLSGPELVIAQMCGSQAKLEALLDKHSQAVHAEQETIDMLGLDQQPTIDHPLVRDSIERLVAAIVLACEFAGTYRLGVGEGKTTYGHPALMDAASLGRVIAGLEGTSNVTRSAEVAGLFYERSASPMETALALMLTLPVNVGGLGLPRTELNAAVDVSAWRGTLSDRDTVTPDMLWRSQHVAIEYDSAEFHESTGAGQLEKDARRSNILATCGYHVLRVTPGVVRTVHDVELLGRQVAYLLGVELVQPSDIQMLRRTRLFSMLMS